jgi:hypothetical protein
MHMASMGEMGNAYKILVTKPKGKRSLVDGKISERILEK